MPTDHYGGKCKIPVHYQKEKSYLELITCLHRIQKKMRHVLLLLVNHVPINAKSSLNGPFGAYLVGCNTPLPFLHRLPLQLININLGAGETVKSTINIVSALREPTVQWRRERLTTCLHMMKAHGLERRIKQGSLASAWKPEPESPGLCEGLAPTILFLLVSLELLSLLSRGVTWQL